jgi:SAM-dependent methyltransferase
MLQENLIKLYEKSFRENREMPALTDYFKNETFSYYEMAKEIAKLHLLFKKADIKQGDALSLPFADGEFDRVVAAEVLEHIPADIQAIEELVRVLRPGGTLAVSVPRCFPEVVNWKLSDDYHNAEGGHIRIYTAEELVDKVTKAGRFNDGTPGDAMVFTGKDYAHGLHTPYWWIKCAVGVTNDEHPLAKAYHRLLVWEIMKNPKALQVAGKVLDPLIGKSMVLYFVKPTA